MGQAISCFVTLIACAMLCLMPKAPSVKWTRAHFLVRVDLYCKLPFGQLHRGNPIIIDVAQKMGHTLAVSL